MMTNSADGYYKTHSQTDFFNYKYVFLTNMATEGKENENMHQNEAIGYSLVSIPHSNLGQTPNKNTPF